MLIQSGNRSADAASHAAAIEDYALIGDCHTAALVSKTGSIDWLCWPRFDSPACFAALLGSPANGRWRIAPTDSQATVTRRYLPGTMILETVFETASGSVALIDFMAIENDVNRAHCRGPSRRRAYAVRPGATLRIWLRHSVGDPP